MRVGPPACLSIFAAKGSLCPSLKINISPWHISLKSVQRWMWKQARKTGFKTGYIIHAKYCMYNISMECYKLLLNNFSLRYSNIWEWNERPLYIKYSLQSHFCGESHRLKPQWKQEIKSFETLTEWYSQRRKPSC